MTYITGENIVFEHTYTYILWYYLFSRCLNFAESRQETIPRGLKFAHAPERGI